MPLTLTLNGDFCLRLTLTLLHFLWQGLAVALLTLAAGAVLRRAGAAVRYWMLVAALVLMALCPLVTYLSLAPQAGSRPMGRASSNVMLPPNKAAGSGMGSPASGTRIDPLAPAIKPVGIEHIPAGSLTLKERLSAIISSDACRRAAPWVALGYFAGVLLMLARLLLALRGGRGLRRRSNPVTDPAIRSSLQSAAAAVRLRAVPAIAWCQQVAVPTVVGILKPTILLPLTLSSGLAPEQVEMLLLHELAHLRRYDHWTNLAQWAIETALFFHPAVWWLSRRIRTERELACDDMVLTAGVGQAPYAESLLRMAELSRVALAPTPGTALALGSHGPRPSAFGQRILRLIEGRETLESLRPARIWPLGMVLVLMILSLGAIGLTGNGLATAKEPVRKFEIEVEKILQQSADGQRMLLADGEISLRLEAAQITVKRLANGKIQIIPIDSGALPVKVGVLLTGGKANKARIDRIHAIAANYPVVQTSYIVQKAWDRGLVEIPTAMIVPQGMIETREWKKWKRTGYMQQLEYVDELGRKYVAQAWAWSQIGQERYPLIPRFERLRTDGTLEAYTVFSPEHQPDSCYFYDSDGKTRIGYTLFWFREPEPSLRDLTWRDRAGNYHQYHLTPQGVIPWEFSGKLDESGMFSIDKQLIGGIQFEKAVYQVDPAKAVEDLECPIQLTNHAISPNTQSVIDHGSHTLPIRFIANESNVSTHSLVPGAVYCWRIDTTKILQVTHRGIDLREDGTMAGNWGAGVNQAGDEGPVDLIVRPRVEGDDLVLVTERKNKSGSVFSEKKIPVPAGCTLDVHWRREPFVMDGKQYVSLWEGRFVREGKAVETVLFAAAAAAMGDAKFEKVLDLHGRSSDLPLIRVHDTREGQQEPLTFAELYSLKPGEVLRRVAPPYIPGRIEFLNKYNAALNMKNPPPTSAQFILNDKLKIGMQVFATDPHQTIEEILTRMLGLRHYEFEGARKVLDIKAPGDWIVRGDSTPEQRVKALEQMLQAQMGLSITFEKQHVEREVIVASGRFDFKPLAGAPEEKDNPNAIYIYTDALKPHGWESNAGGSTVGEFLDELGDKLNVRIINESETKDTPSLRYFTYDTPSPSNSAALDRLLGNITKQTALRFQRERRPVDVWMVSSKTPAGK